MSTISLAAGSSHPFVHRLREVAANTPAAYWRTGGLWQGVRSPAATTAVLYLPTVAGSFVSAAGAATLGHQDWGQLAFGARLFSWLPMESVLLHRLLTGAETPVALRPTLGIRLAPRRSGNGGPLGRQWGAGPPRARPDRLRPAPGSGPVRLSSWITKAGAVPGPWAFQLRGDGHSHGPVRLVAHGDAGALAVLAPALFVAANGLVLGLAIMTAAFLARGRMFAAPAAASRLRT